MLPCARAHTVSGRCAERSYAPQLICAGPSPSPSPDPSPSPSPFPFPSPSPFPLWSRLFVRILLQWRKLWVRSQWTQHVAACRVRYRVETAYARSTFNSWVSATWPQQKRDSRGGAPAGQFQFYD